MAVPAVLLVPLLAASASAHGEHKADDYTVEVGFDTDPAEAQYPVQQPSGSQLTTRLDRETTRLSAAVAAHREAADQDVAEARRLATIGLAVGALGLLTAVGVGVVALRRRS